MMEDLNKATEAEKDKEDSSPRDEWSNKIEFILSCVGFAVGLGE